jgi:hypothetical protein
MGPIQITLSYVDDHPLCETTVKYCTVKPVLRGHIWDKEKVAL